MIIGDNETIDDLGINNYKIFQIKDGFKFGIDAILLSNFVRVKKDDIGIDLCSGTGIVPILISAKSNIKKFIGVEIQKEMVILANKSAKYNKIDNKVEFLNEDVNKINDLFRKSSIDIVTVNPPYFKTNTIASKNEKKNISRHEILVNLDDIFKISNYLLKPNKPLYMIHKPERLVELFIFAKKYNLEPKEIQFVYPNKTKSPNLVLIKYVKNSKEGLKYLNPIFVYDEYGNYTCDIKQIYTKKSLEG